MFHKANPVLTAACACILIAGAAHARPSIEPLGPGPAPYNSLNAGTVTGCGDPACGILLASIGNSLGGSSHAFRWSSGIGYTDLSVAAGLNELGSVTLSADGTSYAGTIYDVNGAYHWVPPAAPVSIGLLSGMIRSRADAISADGSKVAGVMSPTPSGNGSKGFVWSVTSGTVDMNLPATTTWLSADWISADGTTVIGEIQLGSQRSAYRWQAGNIVYLNGVGGAYVIDVTASPDGETIVGRTSTNRMTVWRNGVPSEYGSPPSPYNGFTNFGVSSDGGTVVGQMYNTSTGGSRGFIWKKNTGFRDAAPYLVELGVTMPGWNIFEVTGISHDGRTVVGRGNGGLFRVQNAVPPACEGDFNGDGATNVADLTAFLAVFGKCPASTGYAANFNMAGPDPCINVADLVEFLGVFGNTCP